MLGGILALLPGLTKIIERVIPDPDKALELKNEIMTAALNAESELYKAKGSIITAEAQGESWMQRNWRPITMLTFVFIIANNYIFAPYMAYLSSIFGWYDGLGEPLRVPVLEIHDGMWALLQIGIGGYIASRGAEKIASSVQQGGVPLIGSRAYKPDTPSNAVTKEDLRADREALLRELKGA